MKIRAIQHYSKFGRTIHVGQVADIPDAEAIAMLDIAQGGLEVVIDDKVDKMLDEILDEYSELWEELAKG